MAPCPVRALRMPESNVPHTVGPYRLLRVLGRGSMGVVHLAVERSTRRHVALKTLALGSGADQAEAQEASARFRIEAENVRHLSHPGIVTHLFATSSRCFWP